MTLGDLSDFVNTNSSSITTTANVVLTIAGWASVRTRLQKVERMIRPMARMLLNLKTPDQRALIDAALGSGDSTPSGSVPNV